MGFCFSIRRLIHEDYVILTTTFWGTSCYHSHFTDKKVECPEGKGNFLRTHREGVTSCPACPRLLDLPRGGLSRAKTRHGPGNLGWGCHRRRGPAEIPLTAESASSAVWPHRSGSDKACESCNYSASGANDMFSRGIKMLPDRAGESRRQRTYIYILYSSASKIIGE